MGIDITLLTRYVLYVICTCLNASLKSKGILNQKCHSQNPKNTPASQAGSTFAHRSESDCSTGGLGATGTCWTPIARPRLRAVVSAAGPIERALPIQSINSLDGSQTAVLHGELKQISFLTAPAARIMPIALSTVDCFLGVWT